MVAAVLFRLLFAYASIDPTQTGWNAWLTPKNVCVGSYSYTWYCICQGHGSNMNRQNTWSFNRKCQKEIKRVDWLSFSSETRHVTVRLWWKTSAETHTQTRFTSKCNKKYTYFQAIVGVKASLLSRRTWSHALERMYFGLPAPASRQRLKLTRSWAKMSWQWVCLPSKTLHSEGRNVPRP